MDDTLKFKVKRPKYHKRKTKDNSCDRVLVYITRVISRGDYDPERKSHVIAAKVALSKGIIDKEFNILKEEYLICKTKR